MTFHGSRNLAAVTQVTELQVGRRSWIIGQGGRLTHGFFNAERFPGSWQDSPRERLLASELTGGHRRGRPPPGNAGASRNGTRQGSSSRKPHAPPVSLRTSASQSSACKFIHLHGLTWRVVVSGKPHDPSTCCPVLIPCSGSERGRKRMSR